MELSAIQTYLSTVVIMGVGTFILMASSAYLGYASSQLRQNKSQQEQNTISNVVWYLLALIALWFSVALAASTGNFTSIPLVVPFALVPIIGGALLSFQPKLKKLIETIPTHWLIYLQTYRIAGGLFIFPYMTEGILTQGFSINAGIGDMLTGILALPVAWLVLKHGAGKTWVRTAFYAWTALGILDLIVAFGSAGYFGFAVEGVQPLFPITTIPLFFGPPFGILIHIITVRNFQLRQQT